MGYSKDRRPVKSPGLNYSTDEIDTGGTWIDGKQVFRKVLNMGELPKTNVKSVAHGISGLGQVISIHGIATSDTGIQRTIPYVSDTATDAVTLEVSNTSIGIITYSNWTDHTAYVVIEYTK